MPDPDLPTRFRLGNDHTAYRFIEPLSLLLHDRQKFTILLQNTKPELFQARQIVRMGYRVKGFPSVNKIGCRRLRTSK